MPLLDRYWKETLSLIRSLEVNKRALITSISPKYLVGVWFDSSGLFTCGIFTNPFGVANAQYLGVYSLSDLSLVFSSSNFAGVFDRPLFYSRAWAETYADFLTSSVYAFDWGCDQPDKAASLPVYFKSSLNTIWDDATAVVSLSNYYNSRLDSGNCYCLDCDYVVFDSSRVVFAPTGTDLSSRPASLMQTINNYNEDNSYTDNSETVNYYIGTVDAGGDVTNIYNVNLYDEETLIFTEPFTGAQYQTTGWTYDYTTRCYTLDLSSGTFTLDGSDIDKVKLTYGDDFLTLDYYSGSTLVESDEYAYVRVAQSECALNGHTYTYETVKEATCTTPGERKYTCSVCGNEYAEEIPVIGHAYEYSIYQEPTCLESGIGIYTCSMCGDQYTEPIEPKGHTPEMIEYVPTEYDENGTAVSVGYTLYRCTVCGTEYKVNDEIDIKDESWFSWLASLFKKLISAIVNGLASGLEYLVENVIVTVTDLLVQFTRWSFGLLDVDSLTDWFNWFSDDNEYFANDFGGSEVDVWAYS